MSRNLLILKNYILWLLTFILICIIGCSNVFADTYENIGYLNNYAEVLVEVSYTGSPLPLTRTNTYQLEQVEAMNIHISNYSFSGDKTYSLEFYTPNTTLQYANLYSATGFGANNTSYNCSVFDITYTDIHYPNFRFKCPASVNSIYIRITNSSGNYIMPTGIFAWNYVYLRSVITEDNTQDIINNQNQNTQDIINSQYTCKDTTYDLKKYIDKKNYFLASTGVETSTTYAYAITDYLKITSNSTYSLSLNYSVSNPSYCLYDINQNLISCAKYNSATSISISSSNAQFIRFSISSATGNTSSLSGNVCFKDSQLTTNAIDNLTDVITDDSSLDVSSLGNTLGWLPAGPIDSIINLPLNLFNSLTTALGLTCTSLTLPIPYVNRNMTIPCLSTLMEQMGFSTFWNWVGTIASIVIMYRYLLNLYKYYDDLTTLKANFISDFGGAP